MQVSRTSSAAGNGSIILVTYASRKKKIEGGCLFYQGFSSTAVEFLFLFLTFPDVHSHKFPISAKVHPNTYQYISFYLY